MRKVANEPLYLRALQLVVALLFAGCSSPQPTAKPHRPDSGCYTPVRQLGDGKSTLVAVSDSDSSVAVVSDNEISYWSKNRLEWRRELPNPADAPLGERLLFDASHNTMRVVASDSWMTFSLDTGRLGRVNGLGGGFCHREEEVLILNVWRDVEVVIEIGQRAVFWRHGESVWRVTEQSVTRTEPGDERDFRGSHLWRCGIDRLYLEQRGEFRKVRENGVVSGESSVFGQNELPFVAKTTGRVATARIAGKHLHVGEACWLAGGKVLDMKLLEWGFVTLEESARGRAASLYRFPKLGRVTPCRKITPYQFPRVVKPTKKPTILQFCDDPFKGF